MSDNQQGQETEKETQSPVPSDDKPTDDSKELPEEAKDRTKEQFEKLKKHNQELSEKVKNLEGYRQPQPSVLESLRPPSQPQQVPSSQYKHLNQQQVDSIQKELVKKGKDGYDYVDTNLLQQRLQTADQRAKRAEMRAQRTEEKLTRLEETQQMRDTYSQFPQLDPNGNKFDSNFYNLVRGELMNQAMRGEKDLQKAATTVNSALSSYKTSDKKESQEPKKDTKKAQKQQINASGSAGRTDVDFDQLRRESLQGKKGAIAERLKRSGY